MAEKQDALKEFFSFPDTLAILCFHMNYHRKYKRTEAKTLSYFLNMPEKKLMKLCTILESIKLVEKYVHDKGFQIEMKEVDNSYIKQALHEVVWENKERFSVIYKGLVRKEIESSIRLN